MESPTTPKYLGWWGSMQNNIEKEKLQFVKTFLLQNPGFKFKLQDGLSPREKLETMVRQAEDEQETLMLNEVDKLLASTNITHSSLKKTKVVTDSEPSDAEDLDETDEEEEDEEEETAEDRAFIDDEETEEGKDSDSDYEPSSSDESDSDYEPSSSDE